MVADVLEQYHSMWTLPLIRLPAPSPRKDGEKCDGRNDGTNSEAWKISESIDEVNFSPFLRGEGAGRRMRGGAFV